MRSIYRVQLVLSGLTVGEGKKKTDVPDFVLAAIETEDRRQAEAHRDNYQAIIDSPDFCGSPNMKVIATAATISDFEPWIDREGRMENIRETLNEELRA